MFTTPCFIRKNSESLRKSLIELGYQVCACASFDDAAWLDCDDTKEYTFNVHGVGYSSPEFPREDQQWHLERFLSESKDLIDCGDNEDLFLAVAALRDDSDMNQWFVCDQGILGYGEDGLPKWLDFEGDWRFCESDEFDAPLDSFRWHKATVEELIEHFKDK